MLIIEAIFIVYSSACVSCTITGLSYMDPQNLKPLKSPPLGEDPCNPLYWYPKQMPDYCYFRNSFKPGQAPIPISLPIPIPLPQPSPPFPFPMYPVPSPYPISSGYPIPAGPMPMPPLPMSLYPQQMSIYSQPMPLPYGIPLAPTNPMLPVAGVPAMPYPRPYPIGMVPGLPGLVTPDGGINILPFSDAYADLLEKHKQKEKRKKYKSVHDAHDGCSGRREKMRRRHRD